MEPGASPVSSDSLERELRWKTAPPEEPFAMEVLVTDAAGAAPPAPAPTAPSGAAAAAAPGPSIPKATSEDDIIMMDGKVHHVHGDLAKNAVHTPQHAPSHLNYAAVAREEIHDVAVHPPPVKLMSGAPTGVEEWDKVNSPKARREA